MIFVGVTALLVATYFLFTRFNFTTLYEGLDPDEASAIVAELDTPGDEIPSKQ